MTAARLRHLAIDTGPLRRHRNVRLLFTGQLVSFFGSMITSVALPYHVYALTKSTAAVGLIGVTQLVPLVLTGLWGGLLADRVDRRRLIVTAELGLALVSLTLAAFAWSGGTSIAMLYAASAAMAGLNGIHRPSLEALTPRLVERHEIPAMSALSSLRSNLGMIGGPAAGGLVIAQWGVMGAYLVDAVSFAVSLAALAQLTNLPQLEVMDGAGGLAAIRDGLRYAWKRQVLMGTYVVDIVAMGFATVTPLMPAIADGLGGPQYLGLLYGAPSVGALLATVTSGWVGKVRRHGLAVLWAAAGTCAAIALFGVTSAWVVPAVALLGLSGFFDMISGIFRMTIWNQTIPDSHRGRLASVEMISYSTGPLLGNTLSGFAASAFGLGRAVGGSAALGLLLVGVCARALPEFRSYNAAN